MNFESQSSVSGLHENSAFSQIPYLVVKFFGRLYEQPLVHGMGQVSHYKEMVQQSSTAQAQGAVPLYVKHWAKLALYWALLALCWEIVVHYQTMWTLFPALPGLQHCPIILFENYSTTGNPSLQCARLISTC